MSKKKEIKKDELKKVGGGFRCPADNAIYGNLDNDKAVFPAIVGAGPQILPDDLLTTDDSPQEQGIWFKPLDTGVINNLPSDTEGKYKVPKPKK